MPGLNLAFVMKGDPPPWGDLTLASDKMLERQASNEELRMAFLEHGMSSGRTSVAFLIDTGARYVFVETSLTNLASAVVAARAKFPDEFRGTPLDENPDMVEVRHNTLLALRAVVQMVATIGLTQTNDSFVAGQKQAYDTVLGLIDAQLTEVADDGGC